MGEILGLCVLALGFASPLILLCIGIYLNESGRWR